ncbi:hypothetical protein [Dactylosporangium matsuzakiense]|uniref:hypothetical protein n=1 Tax=Dactylosporangium matsuzakiense TaxID=53360 RepID=UPI0021C356F7|nr:hypothetical protein [Dactylosporangium matsuzakiense]UWZ42601.1 hypothetical protein Dmats_34275 [Dactylosporangium matsuzakiense]
MSRLLAVVTAVGLVGACGRAEVPAPAVSAPAEPAGDRADRPDGWRWESYGGIEVGVPGDWGWDSQAQRLDAWCIKPGNHPPAVARPGAAVPAVGCGVDRTTPPAGHLIANTGWTVGVQNGFDDGTTVRRLTKPAVRPLVTGPNRVYGGFSGTPEKRDMLLPSD